MMNSFVFARPCTIRLGRQSIMIFGGDVCKHGPLSDRGHQQLITCVTTLTRDTVCGPIVGLHTHVQNADLDIRSLTVLCASALSASRGRLVFKVDGDFIDFDHGPNGAGTTVAPQIGSKSNANFPCNHDLLNLAPSPVNIKILREYLTSYNSTDRNDHLNGFTNGFSMHYNGP
ncbi:hypothetical protein DPMN_061015 [Dreissena polymorpha]|uniref:Uncharacterized protein n=1 Tax=Dreissena polymorpha TaxID=45954 RepID=A0A9D4C6Z1_DREPO|nr:hypothetical protein DPMN_061015 [Dreissena polymorpha]